MANWSGDARSNYFKVKDMEKFLAFAKKYHLNVRHGSTDQTRGMVAFVIATAPTGGWVGDEQPDEYEPIFKEICDMLTEDSIFIYIEVGTEKMNLLTGHTRAMNHKGEVAEINLNTITELAKARFGPDVIITDPEY